MMILFHGARLTYLMSTSVHQPPSPSHILNKWFGFQCHIKLVRHLLLLLQLQRKFLLDRIWIWAVVLALLMVSTGSPIIRKILSKLVHRINDFNAYATRVIRLNRHYDDLLATRNFTKYSVERLLWTIWRVTVECTFWLIYCVRISIIMCWLRVWGCLSLLM